MEIINNIIQIVIAIGIFNVWILRFNKPSDWRGSDAKNMKEEFASYGLSPILMLVVGFFKLFFASLLIAGIWYPILTRPAALGLAILMTGAVAMHLKVQDPIKKFLPSFVLLLLCLFVAYFS
ncbi:MAG TPA: DoxX family protein [Parachlamydiaceae bacterium]|nr:DoxX family protein [Parachlamydiaceae bacterium]